MIKIEGIEKNNYYNGDLTCLRRNGSQVDWYWTPNNYNITYHLFGHLYVECLESYMASLVDNDAFRSYILNVIEKQIEESEDSDMFAELYIRMFEEE